MILTSASSSVTQQVSERSMRSESHNAIRPLKRNNANPRWNPMNHVSEWKTPELVIHSGRDYRLVDGQGIGACSVTDCEVLR